MRTNPVLRSAAVLAAVAAASSAAAAVAIVSALQLGAGQIAGPFALPVLVGVPAYLGYRSDDARLAPVTGMGAVAGGGIVWAVASTLLPALAPISASPLIPLLTLGWVVGVFHIVGTAYHSLEDVVAGGHG